MKIPLLPLVLMSAGRHAELMQTLDDLEDRLAVHESDDLTMPWEKLKAELGLGTRSGRQADGC